MSVLRRARSGASGAAYAGVALAAIVLLWGAIPAIVAIERRLPADLQWLGHAGFHIWTATVAGVLCAVALRAVRSRQVPHGLLRRLSVAVIVAAGVVAVTNALEAIGAQPSLRAFHDVINAVGAPAGWVLLTVLCAVVFVGMAVRRGGDSAR